MARGKSFHSPAPGLWGAEAGSRVLARACTRLSRRGRALGVQDPCASWALESQKVESAPSAGLGVQVCWIGTTLSCSWLFINELLEVQRGKKWRRCGGEKSASLLTEEAPKIKVSWHFIVYVSFYLQNRPKLLWCPRTNHSQEDLRSPSCVLQQVIPNQRSPGPWMICLSWLHTGTGFVSCSLFLLSEKSEWNFWTKLIWPSPYG